MKCGMNIFPVELDDKVANAQKDENHIYYVALDSVLDEWKMVEDDEAYGNLL